MKWAAVLLGILGFAAAVCAGLLVNTLRASTAPAPIIMATTTEVQPMISVLYATTGLPAMTVVDAKAVVVRAVPKNQVPKDYISSPVDVVGKVVGVPVVEGQAFTLACFADRPTARQVADAIPFGKRAVGISVTDYSGLEGMLYPGSTVDVMASFKTQNGESQDAVTTTLLENIQVLGIERQTVVSSEKSIMDNSAYSASRGNTRRVTLLVTTEQAKRLQLAMEQGILSLALRNPLDSGRADQAKVSVKRLLNEMGPFPANDTQVAAAPKADPFVNPTPAPIPAPAPATKPAEPPQWDVQIIRGGVSETKLLPMPKRSTDVEPMSVNR